MVLSDLGSICAVQGVQDHIHTVSLMTAVDALRDCFCLFGDIFFFELCQAVGTVSAVGCTVFSEISQNIGPQTVMCEAVKSHLPQSLFIALHDQFLCSIIQFLIVLIIFNEKAICDYILSTVQKDAF